MFFFKKFNITLNNEITEIKIMLYTCEYMCVCGITVNYIIVLKNLL